MRPSHSSLDSGMEAMPSHEHAAVLHEVLRQIKERNAQMQQQQSASFAIPKSPAAVRPIPTLSGGATRPGRDEPWRIEAMLQSFGLLPGHATKLISELRTIPGIRPPRSHRESLALVAEALLRAWKSPPPPAGDSSTLVHVFIGAPGVGKTTCLSKWLTREVLGQGRSAHVWRLDGRQANTAEALSLYAEVLGAPVHRAKPAGAWPAAASHFVDLPGVNWRDTEELAQLERQLADLGHSQVHLVLNAGYDTLLLLAQVEAFGRLPCQDLIISHMDEVPNWGKLWNLVLGTKYAIAFLSAGQNVPEDFQVATAECLLPGTSPANTCVYAPNLPV